MAVLEPDDFSGLVSAVGRLGATAGGGRQEAGCGEIPFFMRALRARSRSAIACLASLIWLCVAASWRSLSCRDARMVRWMASSSLKSSVERLAMDEAAAIFVGILRSHKPAASVLSGCRWMGTKARLVACGCGCGCGCGSHSASRSAACRLCSRWLQGAHRMERMVIQSVMIPWPVGRGWMTATVAECCGKGRGVLGCSGKSQKLLSAQMDIAFVVPQY